MESFPSCLLIAVVFNFLDFFLSDIRLWIKETKQKKSEFYLNTFVSVMNVPVGSQCLPQNTRWGLKKNWRKVDFEVTWWFLYRFFLTRYYLSLRNPWLKSDLPTPIVIDINTIEVWESCLQCKTRICSFDHSTYSTYEMVFEVKNK